MPWRTSPTVLVSAGARECGSTDSSGKPRNPFLAHLAHAFPQYTRPCTHTASSPPVPPQSSPRTPSILDQCAKCARNNSLWFFPLCLAFVAVLVLVRSRVWESANLRQAAWRTAGRTWRTAGALRKAPVRRGTRPRKAAKSLSGALGAPFSNNRRRVVALGWWRFRVGEVSRRGAFCVQGRVYWWEACAKCAREGFRGLGRLRNAAHGGAPAGTRTAVLVRQGRRDPPSGRVFGRSGGCRPGR